MSFNKFSLFFLAIICFGNLQSCKEDGGTEPDHIQKVVDNKLVKKAPLKKSEEKVFGVDISHYQENINWEKAKKSGMSFVFIKATGGETYLDPSFYEHWAGAKKHDIARSAYHFYYSKDDPIKQADFFIRKVRDYIGEQNLPPVIDVEEASINSDISPKDFANDILKFLERVEYELNRKPMVYCDPSFAKKYLNHPVLRNYYLWIADYEVKEPTIPEVWANSGYTFWQKESKAMIPGIPGKVDFDVFYGTQKELENFHQTVTKEVTGIDVSHHQSDIDWEIVKQSGISFAFIKATGGMTFVDPSFHKHWNGARDAGVKCGPYHFYYSKDSPYKQAKFFIRNIKKYMDENSLPPVVDVEEVSVNSTITPEKFAEHVLIFLKQVKKALGRKPIVYCDPSFAKNYLNNPGLKDYYLWIADYKVSKPQIPKVWKKNGYEFWQNSATTKVPGVKGLVDHDVFIGSKEKLLNL